jgi:phosphofructokinase-like protein
MKVGISTGGGDAPGLNAVIRAATLSALRRGWEVVGIREGFSGLLTPEKFPDGDGVIPLDRATVSGIGHLGGTILGTTNIGNPCAYPVQQPDGTWIEVDRTHELVGLFAAAGIDALITIGGDGSLGIGCRLHREGLHVIGVPKTIDNDLERTIATFGFDTAVEFATDCIDRVLSTATAHNRIMVVEVMGRYAGWIALHSGVAASAHAILIPEIPFDLECVAEMIQRRAARRRNFAIVVVAEGAVPIGGTRSVLGKAVGQAEKLGGMGARVAEGLHNLTGKESRTVVLGHLLRGGSPTASDRLLGTRFGAAAVRALDEGRRGVMVALNPPVVEYVPLEEATSRSKTVDPLSDTVISARDLGICFGD